MKKSVINVVEKDVGVKTSSTLLMKIKQGVLTGSWDEAAAKRFDDTYRQYLLGYLRTSRWRGFFQYHDEIISQAFVRLFPYITKGWERHGTGSFRHLLKTIIDRGAAQDVLKEELDLISSDEFGEDGKPKKVPRGISIEHIAGRDEDGRAATRDEQIEMARRWGDAGAASSSSKRKEEEDMIRWHKDALYLALLNVLGEVEDRDDKIVWERLVDRKPSKQVAETYGVTENNVNVITNRKLAKIDRLAKEFMEKFVYNGYADPDRTFKGMWSELAKGSGKMRVSKLEKAIASQLALIEERDRKRYED